MPFGKNEISQNALDNPRFITKSRQHVIVQQSLCSDHFKSTHGRLCLATGCYVSWRRGGGETHTYERSHISWHILWFPGLVFKAIFSREVFTLGFKAEQVFRGQRGCSRDLFKLVTMTGKPYDRVCSPSWPIVQTLLMYLHSSHASLLLTVNVRTYEVYREGYHGDTWNPFSCQCKYTSWFINWSLDRSST